MKKALVLLPILVLAGASLTACEHDNRPRITYGTLVETEATLLSYEQLQNKVADKENLLISVYEDVLPCGCWTTFHNIINQYVDKYDTRIYYIPRSQFSEDADKFGLSILTDGTKPTFAFIKEGKKASEYIYGTDTKTMFETLEGLRSAVTRIAKDPQYMFVDQAYLDNALFVEKQDRVVVHYIWNFCPDCNDCFPYVLSPYTQNHEFKTNVWIIDLAIPGILLDENGKMDKTSESYVGFLKDHHMSKAGDDKFGYDRGFVPTTQIWENGELKDMNVYFNDEISIKDGKYYVSRSYYNEENISKFQYTDKVLEGMEISVEEVDINETYGTISWNKEYARRHHKPILESFLNTYVKK